MRKSFFRRYLIEAVSIAIVFLFLSGCAGFSHNGGENSGGVPVTVLFFNDLHGYLMPFTVKSGDEEIEVGGIARMAAVIEKIRLENRKNGVHTVVLVAGDILQGTPMSTIYKGKPDVECLNAMGVTAMTIGNHEFDFGFENLMALEKQARFPFLSANIVWRDKTERLFAPACRIFFEPGVILTVIGTTTQQLLTTTLSENVARVDVLDAVAAVKDVYGHVKNDGPVILLSHSRHQTDRAIALAIPELAAIIGGHDQILLSPHRMVGRVPVFQAFEKGKYLGKLDLVIHPAEARAQIQFGGYIPITADIPADPGIQKLVNRYYQGLDEQFSRVIGHAETFLDGERERVRHEETNLGNFVADLMRDYTGANIALVNSGGLRASIRKGPVTVEDIFKAMPYANEIVLLELTGDRIEAALNRSVRADRGEEDGGFLQVSGIRFSVKNHRVENILVGPEWTPLMPDRGYSVAMPLFLATGGDGYELFSQMEGLNTGLLLRELIVTTFEESDSVSSRVDGRIQRIE